MPKNILVLIEHLQGAVAEISYSLLAAARELSQPGEGKVCAILLGNQIEGLASTLHADQVVLVEHPLLAEFNSEAYSRTLASLITEYEPRLVLLGDTSVGSGVAAQLSVQLDLPLVSNCKRICAENGSWTFESQICGGKMMVEGELPSPSCLVALIPGGYRVEDGVAEGQAELIRADPPGLDDMRIKTMGFTEPVVGDVDITREAMLIAVGRGIEQEDNLELVDELAAALGAAVCASRPIVDQGWLGTDRMVGKSGKAVKPKLYLSLGISGAPEHLEGMNASDLIIAVNTDPTAPIFEAARYGVDLDLLYLLPALTEAVLSVKGG
jgi:electron transfer flavoprotein alpha subunit